MATLIDFLFGSDPSTSRASTITKEQQDLLDTLSQRFSDEGALSVAGLDEVRTAQMKAMADALSQATPRTAAERQQAFQAGVVDPLTTELQKTMGQVASRTARNPYGSARGRLEQSVLGQFGKDLAQQKVAFDTAEQQRVLQGLMAAGQLGSMAGQTAMGGEQLSQSALALALAPRFENVVSQGQPGFLQSLAAGVGTGAGTEAGKQLGPSLLSLFGL